MFVNMTGVQLWKSSEYYRISSMPYHFDILNGKLNSKKGAYRVLFSTSGHFSKSEGKASPLPSSSAPVRVAKYASVSLNMSTYP